VPEGPLERLHQRITELSAENAALRDALGEQAQLNEELRAKVRALEWELSRHSGNSGKPPSSDTVTQRQEQNEARESRAERRRKMRARLKEMEARDKAKRRPGKQPGDEGHRLSPVEDPDAVVMHRPGCCGSCGADLGDAEVLDVERRQVFDVPEPRVEVTEHRAERRRCGCGAVTAGTFPSEARAEACYGPRLRALAIYLLVRQHLPVARAAELAAFVLGQPVSTGWLATLPAEAAEGLGGFIAELRRQLAAADVLHLDETGTRVSGARYWLHVTATDLLTLLAVHERRGIEAIDDIGVLGEFRGTAVHDGALAYAHYTDCEHALCLAHLLRDLVAVGVWHTQTAWTDAMAELMVEVKRAIEEALAAGQDGLTKNQLKAFRRRYTLIVKAGYAANPKPEHRKRDTVERKAYNLVRRFDNKRAEICRYWADARVPPTNNQAERDLRMAKLQVKISGCFRSIIGAEAFATIRSYLQTAAKQGVHLLDALVQLFRGDPWIPAAAGSSP